MRRTRPVGSSTRSDHGPVVVRTDPRIALWVGEGEPLDAVQARAVAALLLQAADRLDGLVRS